VSGRMYVVGGAHWDDRRNTSQNRGPDPRALDECLRSCAQLRRSDPALVKWIEDGHPTLTPEEHRDRFGRAYERGGKR